MEATKLFVAHDESNNGRPLEVHSSVFSEFLSDVAYCNKELNKVRVHGELFERLRKRDYRFVLVNKEDKIRLRNKSERLGIILTSLLMNVEMNLDLKSLDLYLDGNKSQKEIEYVRDSVSCYLSFPRMRINITSGPRLDQHYPLVNMADQLAHYLYKCGKHILSVHPKRNELIV